MIRHKRVDNLKEYFDIDDSILQVEKFLLGPNEEYKVQNLGMYVVSFAHSGGVVGQSISAIMAFTTYSADNKFVKPAYILPSTSDAATLEYNPVTRIIRRTTTNASLQPIPYYMIKISK